MDTRLLTLGGLLAGRLLFGGMFLWSGISNLAEIDGRIGYAASKGLPAAAFLVPAASLLLVAGGISLLTGFRPILGVAAIAAFLVGVTPLMHNFWALKGFEQIIEMHSFEGNVGLLGGAIALLAIPRPWPVSADRLVQYIAQSTRTPATAEAI